MAVCRGKTQLCIKPKRKVSAQLLRRLITNISLGDVRQHQNTALPREQLLNTEQSSAPSASASTASAPTAAASPTPPRKKTSYKKQRELDNLPERIKGLEEEQKAIQGQLADGKLYVTDNAKALQLAQREAAIETELLQTLERWEVLS
jgi:ABC transporter C-terminal domain